MKTPLVGEQRKVLSLPRYSHVLIKGVAGSGKTTIALYRAVQLAKLDQLNLFSENKKRYLTIIFSFNKALSKYTEQLINGSPETEGVEITNFHKWVYRFFEDSSQNPLSRTAKGSGQRLFVQQAIQKVKEMSSNAAFLNKEVDFFIEEISFMKGRMINSLSDYIESDRTGRGRAVQKEQRKLIWSVFQSYQEILDKYDMVDFDDYAIFALKKIDEKSSDVFFNNLIIDECQDFSKAQVAFLLKLLPKENNSVTIIADAAQQIYKRGFSWKDLGLSIQGKSIELKKNYRNARSIALAANSLLQNDPNAKQYTKIEMIDGDGDGLYKPTLCELHSIEHEVKFVVSNIARVKEHNSKLSICVLHRNHQGLDKFIKPIKNEGFEIFLLKDIAGVDFEDESIKLATMSSIKGLEFDIVIVTGLDAETLPNPIGFSEPNDPVHVDTERRLLYTSMTRAKKELVMTYVNNPSRYIAEIDGSYLNIEDC